MIMNEETLRLVEKAIDQLQQLNIGEAVLTLRKIQKLLLGQ